MVRLAQCLSGRHQAQGSTPALLEVEHSLLEVEAGGAEVQGHLRPIGSQSVLQKRKQFKGAFLLTSTSSSVLFLSKPVLERGAPDTGVTHHAELLSTKSMQIRSPRSLREEANGIL